MNAIFFILNIFLLQPPVTDSTVNLYDLQFNGIDSSVIHVSEFQNKHLIIAEFDAADPDRGELSALDSLYKSDTEHISIIAVPVLDFGTVVNIEDMKLLLHDTLGLSYIIADTGYAKKEAGTNQQLLMKWITHRSENGHVDNDITEAGQFYLVSTTGILYGNLVRQNIYDKDLISFLINNEPAE
ncbi:hypothetical protein FRZ67_19015 [Panacibacter ginsenosidivorans]|uniref:Uncharacterized protein n=1 Tax=Panacibacter ginsenosidivorans TaxID=1813871 RepID=A0A5B8VE32_9BACT|nr:hypothetical protein [Panacibacter ginsenosidivorans]QEC69295.1 hypothetical protein FRZ67_19015 [Panacibacter ginsenosidivorans]